mmetsp:Transcript_7489/g.13037  ORF Transcript_7489/g.13037 Transcript_7489/m.13037 type:complete len:260 (+) Transcript_7489:96-875(+)|eukprot:CAMPEP_0184520270 /NCGR_PEP_ID=MMETSP0198_2-20121128/7073_1 /TAXON_ID=1112570 /ORGANISM="Thraustochytrium sp., Strain LLF1b" /LENGTH=259 /DNA_ID=CAMNT_0026910847 /DNA_START=189 /DNA_END=968 /DNA_ORIENTATION=-
MRSSGLRCSLAVARRQWSLVKPDALIVSSKQTALPAAAQAFSQKSFTEAELTVRKLLPPELREIPDPLKKGFTVDDVAKHLEDAVPKWIKAWEFLSVADQAILNQGGDPFKKVKVKGPSPIPVVRVQQLDKYGRAYGTGRRKRSTACVWITPGDGSFEVNRKPVREYFFADLARQHAIEPLMVTGQAGKFDVRCIVAGGGLSGQAGAVRLGIARALQNYDPDFRRILKPHGMLTRDSRKVEPKKPGQTKARKKYQWVKR